MVTSARWQTRSSISPFPHRDNDLTIYSPNSFVRIPETRLQHPKQEQGQEEVHYSGEEALLHLHAIPHPPPNTVWHNQEKIPHCSFSFRKDKEEWNLHVTFWLFRKLPKALVFVSPDLEEVGHTEYLGARWKQRHDFQLGTATEKLQ